MYHRNWWENNKWCCRFRFGYADVYNLLECSSNYSDTTGSLWFYSKDQAKNFNVDIVSTDNLKSFKYKTKLLGNTAADRVNGILRHTAIVMSLSN